MNSHWPVFLAVVMLSIAVYFGWRRQNDLADAASVPVKYRTLPKTYDPNATAATPPVKNTPAAKSNPNNPAPPATQPVTPTLPVKPMRATPPVGTQPVTINTGAMPAAPVVGPGAANLPVVAAGPVDRDAIFGVLRASLQQHFGAAPMITNEGFAVVVDGARIDVNATPNWSIVIFNNTKAQPPEQTPNFLMIQNIVAATLDFDMNNTQARQTGDGKTVRRPISKLGRIIVETDPAMFNSTTIKPSGKTTFAATPATPPATGFQPTNGRTPAAPPVAQPPVTQPPVIPPLTPTGTKPVVPKTPPPVAQPPRAPAAAPPPPPVAPQVKTPTIQQPKRPGAPTADQF